MKKWILSILLIITIFVVGCSHDSNNEKITKKQKEYSMKFSGENKLLKMKDEVEGYFLSKDHNAKETHSFTINWKEGKIPIVINLGFWYYTADGEEKIYLKSVGQNNMDIRTHNQKEITGVDVINFDFDSVQIPEGIKTLTINIKYEYKTSVELEESTITINKND